MKIILQLIGIIALIVVNHAATAQTVYKSTGPDGVVVYSDHPPADGKIDKTMTFDNLPSSPVPPEPALEVQPRAHPAAPPPADSRNKSGVILYASSWCGYCKRARVWLAQNRVNYQEVDIDTPYGRSSFRRASGQGGIPLLVSGARYIRGFTAEAYAAFFASR